MAIIDCKVGSFDSIFSDVEDDTHSIFVIVARNPLMRVDSISFHDSILFV